MWVGDHKSRLPAMAQCVSYLSDLFYLDAAMEIWAHCRSMQTFSETSAWMVWVCGLLASAEASATSVDIVPFYQHCHRSVAEFLISRYYWLGEPRSSVA